MTLTTALGLGFLLMIFIFFSAPAVTAVFNSEHDLLLAAYADSGLRLYFIGFLFAGINIVGTAALSAVESVKYAFCASISTIFFAFVLSACFKMTGIWLAFPAAEFATMFITLSGLLCFTKQKGGMYHAKD